MGVKRFDCGSGGVPFCQGCYRMEESELGDYVKFEDYEKLLVELQGEREAAREGNAVPAGWKLVPVEPTDAMVNMGWRSQHPVGIYRDMLSVAPSEVSQ